MIEHTQRQTVEEAARKVKEGAGEIKDAVVQSSAEMLDKCYQETEGMIKKYPFVTVLAAFGVGALAGVLIARRS